MVYQQMSSAKFVVILFTAIAAASQVTSSRHAVKAQSLGENPGSFPIPSALPDGTTLRVDGSTSMQLTNEALESRFEEQFANVDVQLATSRTDEAIEALISGDIDIVAAGRPLTEEEKGQGLVETPIQREKLAILLGPENTFDSNLTFDQFAQIFRGEITNWSELGGPDLGIRFVDRPDYSDTRRALSTYTVFDDQPFETGGTAAPVAVDETDAVVEALGADGIGYAVVSQVIGRDDVRIIPMHQTLPDDPRYPYSQYRAFVSREDSDPGVLAFLGFATTSPGQEVIVDTPAATAETDATESADVGSGVAEPEVVGSGVDGVVGTDGSDVALPETAEPNTTAPPPETIETVEEEAPAVIPDTSSAGEAEAGGFPWWLLGIPVLGGLLWWFLKGRGDATASGATPAATTPLTAVPVPPAAAPKIEPRIVLTPRNSQAAYAYWEVPSDSLEAAKGQGGEKMKLRLYDVTNRLPNAPLPPHAAEFDCVEAEPDLHLPIKQDDRDYVAEVGYLTGDDRWLAIAQSHPTRVPMAIQEASPSNLNAADVALGGAAVVATGVAAMGAAGLLSKPAEAGVDAGKEHSCLVLTPRNEKKAYAYWEVQEATKTTLKAQGGQDCQLRIYDVTDIDLNQQPPHSVLTYGVAETDCDRFVPLADANRDYIAEIGYRTQDGDWLEIIRSAPMRAATILKSASEEAREGVLDLGTVAGGAAVVTGGLAAAAAVDSQSTDQQTATAPAEATTVQDRPSSYASQAIVSTIELLPRTAQEAEASWEVAEAAREAAKQQGGQQYQLRLYDVTAIDLDTQPPHRMDKYPCDETSHRRAVFIPQTDRDYLVEIGYEAPGDRWIKLARSTHVRITPESGTGSGVSGSGLEGAAGGAMAAGVAVAGTMLAAAGQSTNASLTEAPCAIETVKVHSRHHAFQLDERQMRHIQNSVAATYHLTPGLHILCLREGGFNYGDASHPGEPFVLLWIYGGTITNYKTGVSVSSTWSTLNGYADTLTLNVETPATLCAFFIDTCPDDNLGEVTLAAIRM